MGDSSSDDCDDNVERLDNYEWREVTVLGGDSYVIETYEVHWADKTVSRENVYNDAIGSNVIIRYWAEVVNSVKEQEAMKKRGELFEETKQMLNHRTSYEAAQSLLQSKLPNSLPQNIQITTTTNTPSVSERKGFRQVKVEVLEHSIKTEPIWEPEWEQEWKPEFSRRVTRSMTQKLRDQKPLIDIKIEIQDDQEAKKAPAKKAPVKNPKNRNNSSSLKRTSPHLVTVLPLLEYEEGEDEESEREPMMKVEERLWEVEKVDNYKWTEKKINGKKEIEQTYEVFWVGYTRTTREKASDITPDNMRTYWRLVKKSLDEYEEMRKRGEKFAETMQACKYRKAAEAAEKLRKKKLPGVVVPDLDGYVGECMEVIIISSSDSEEEPPQAEESWVEKYKWQEVPGLHGSTSILQTYKVHWTCGKQPTRESCMNIHSKPIAAYWAEVKEIVKEYDDMKERGEEFAETKFAYQARKALEAAEELRRRNIPYILPIEMHGRSGKNLQLLIDRLDAQIAEKMKGKKPIRRRR